MKMSLQMCSFTFEIINSNVFDETCQRANAFKIDPTASIHLSNVTHWMNFLGLRYPELNKGMYVDGHDEQMQWHIVLRFWNE